MSVDIRESLRKIQPELVEARKAGLDEAQTVERVSRFFGSVLGYDPERELTRDKSIQHTFVDLAVKLGDHIPLLIEVVAAETALQLAHIQEARRAAARDNVSYILLTNGLSFNLYHVTLDETLQVAAAFAVDLRDGVTDEAVEMLQLLHKERLAQGALDEFWKQRSRLGAVTLGRALFSTPVLSALRQELRDVEQIQVDSRVLAASLHELLLPVAR
jgi:hypothetical protein